MFGADNRDELGELIRLAGARTPLPAERAERIRARVEAAWERQVGSVRRGSLRYAAVIAGIAALGVGVLLWWKPAPEPVAVVEQVVTAAADPGAVSRPSGDRRVSVIAGQALHADDRLLTGDGRASLRLSGGASLRIDKDSEVLLTASDAVTLVRGALYLDSESDRGAVRPPVVRTPFGLVREIGTQFEVRLAHDRLRVRIRRGSVRLETSASAYEGRAGDEITLRATGTLERSRVPPYGPHWEWVLEIAPRSSFDERHLGEFLDWVSRETGWTVRFADPETAEIVSQTVVHRPARTGPPHEVLPVVLAACELRHEVDGGVVTISRLDSEAELR